MFFSKKTAQSPRRSIEAHASVRGPHLDKVHQLNLDTILFCISRSADALSSSGYVLTCFSYVLAQSNAPENINSDFKSEA